MAVKIRLRRMGQKKAPLSWLRSGYQTEHSLQRQLTVSSRQQVLKNRK